MREPGADIDILCEGAVVPPERLMKDLGSLEDPVIALRAVDKSTSVSYLQYRGRSLKDTDLFATHPEATTRAFTPTTGPNTNTCASFRADALSIEYSCSSVTISQ